MLRIIAVLMTTVLLGSFCGCGLFASLDLTEEQSGLIAEYAAGLLKKYDKNAIRLMNPDAIPAPVEEEPEAPVEEQVPEEAEPVPEETEAVETEAPSFEDMRTEDATGDEEEESVAEVEYSIMTISDYLDLDGVDVNYKDYEICDTYPDQPDDSWLISMSAREGKKLVVLHFELTNNSDSEVPCDILNAGKQYRLIVNREKRINETVTVLMDSFSQFSGNIPVGGSEQTVLIFELDEEYVDSVSSLDLMIKDSEGSETFMLF